MSQDQILLPGWVTGDCIGQGSFGSVYEIHREEYGIRERAALKVLHIPQDPSQVDTLRASGMDDESITNQFDKQASDIVREYQLMMGLKNSPYVVHCEDLKVERRGLGFTLLLRMELLVPLIQALEQGKAKKEDSILGLARDLCAALETCRQQNILHRDVKPQNIFLSPDGSFKLGDFGIARTAEAGGHATVGVGTHNFMAPEVLFGRSYDSRADIYSLGLVLYWLLNHYRGPFLPQPPAVVTSQIQEEARARRFGGEALPAPARGSRELQAIVLKACAFDPEQRYATAGAMKQDLDALAAGKRSQITATLTAPAPASRGRKKWLLPLAAAGVLAVAAAAWMALPSGGEETMATVPVVQTLPNTSGITPSVAPGTYTQRLRLALGGEGQIFYCLKEENAAAPAEGEYLAYEGEIPLYHGSTTLYAYQEKDGVRGDVFTADYTLDYPREELSFQDPAMEQAIREELGKNSGALSNYDCERLTTLQLNELSSTETEEAVASLADLKHLPALTTLYIGQCTEVTDLSPLANCPELETLTLSKTPAENLDILEALPRLTSLTLSYTGTEDYNGLTKLPRLTSLSLTSPYVTVTEASEDTSSDSIRYIPVGETDALSKFTYVPTSQDEAVPLDDVLRQLPQLTYLCVDLCQLEDQGVLLELPNVTNLRLSGVGSLDGEVLAQLSQLTSLSISQDPTTEDSSAVSRVMSFLSDAESDAAELSDLSFLPGLTSLKTLELERVKDTAQLDYIKQLPNLTRLRLTDCSAAQEDWAVNALRSAMPNCSITITN